MKPELISQYRAALKMLESTIDKCPDHLWTDTSYESPYWQITYHSLHFTALYLSKNENAFIPWRDHRSGIHQLGKLSGTQPDTVDKSYSKPDLKEYIAGICMRLEYQIDEQSLTDPSGFDWLPINKFELHLYNLRHLQHHTGQLIERLHQNGIRGIDWVRTA